MPGVLTRASADSVVTVSGALAGASRMEVDASAQVSTGGRVQAADVQSSGVQSAVVGAPG